MSYLKDPGALRRFWWRSTQNSRLGLACLVVLLSMTTTGFALTTGTAPDAATRADQQTQSVPPAPGERTVTVLSVSAVEHFEGLEEMDGDFVRVRAVGARSTAPCWEDGALAFARKTLDGKKIRIVIGEKREADPDGRLPATVLLPDGQNYAQIVVAAGAGVAAGGSDEKLVSAETSARQNKHGVWATPCAPSGNHTTGSSPPSPATTTTAPDRGTTTVPPTVPVVPPQPTATTTTSTTSPQSPDDVQRGVEMGAPCSPEGAYGVTAKGQDVQCKDKGGKELRWTKR